MALQQMHAYIECQNEEGKRRVVKTDCSSLDLSCVSGPKGVSCGDAPAPDAGTDAGPPPPPPPPADAGTNG